jgi:glucose/arabinose dehydrogenase
MVSLDTAPAEFELRLLLIDLDYEKTMKPRYSQCIQALKRVGSHCCSGIRNNRRWCASLMAPLLAIVASTSVAQVPPSVTLREVLAGFTQPIEMVSANDSTGRMFVAEQTGKVRIVEGLNTTPTIRATPFLDVASIITAGGERGLLGLAFHPQYDTLGYFYVFYTRAGDAALEVARFTRSASNPNVAEPTSRSIVITVPHPNNSNHNGGKIAFDPDGFLVISTGDGGGGGDPDRNSQNRSNLLGKLLRVAVGANAGYTIPSSNPYANSTCAQGICPEIWHYGLRNAWKFSFDRANGDLYIGDVGQNAVEEINFVARGAAGGANFGWGVYEGNNCYNDNYFGPPGACAALQNHARPIATYAHDAAGGRSVTGGYVYRGSKIVALNGFYVYGDFASKRLFATIRNNAGVWSSTTLKEPDPQLTTVSSFAEDDRRELYLLDYGTGKIFTFDGVGSGRCPV